MRKALMIALVHPIHLATLGVAVVSGLIAAWWLFPLGLLVWLGMVIRYVYDPAEKFQQKMDERQPLAPRFSDPFSQIQKIQVRMFNSITQASARNRGALQPVLDRMDSLVEEVYQLCLRMSPVENYQKVSDPISNLQEQLKMLNVQVAGTEDPAAKSNYEESQKALSSRIEQQKKTAAQLERIDAYLSSLINDLNALYGQIIPLQTMKGEKIQQVLPGIISKIEGEINEVKSFASL